MSDAKIHTPLEDAQGLLVGTALVALSVHLLHGASLITGQIAGLSLLLSYVSGWSFGAFFFALNLPFYWLALRRMGGAFTLKTFCAVGLMSLFTELLPRLITFERLDPAAAAVMAGVTAGCWRCSATVPAWAGSASWGCICRTRPGSRRAGPS